MKTHLTSNNLGFSLVMTISALAVVTATTAYLMGLSKNSSVVSASAKATTYIEAERSRIATVLADNNTCMLPGNFGGTQAALRTSITSLVGPSGATLVAQGATYYNNALRIDSIKTRLAVNGDSVDPGDIGTAKGYILQISYMDITVANSRSSYTGKKQSIINIPMYMKVVSGNVADCYALSQNSKVNLAIRASCSPLSSASSKNSLLNLSGSVESDCQHSITFANASPADNTTCTTTTSNVAPSTFTALSGWNLGTSTIDIPATKCSGIATNCSVAGQSAYAVSNSTALCSYAGGTRDGACATGQILYHSSGTSTTCTTVNCSAAYSFVNSISSAGATCYTAPTTTCAGVNQYVKIFNSTGSDVCGILPTMSGTCAGGTFGSSITRDNATANGSLNCSYYNKSKVCSPASAYTFATALGASTVATCTTF